MQVELYTRRELIEIDTNETCSRGHRAFIELLVSTGEMQSSTGAHRDEIVSCMALEG